MNGKQHITLTLSLLLLSLLASAQINPIFIQLEDGLSGDLIKYYPGSKIQFTTREYPKTWRKERITEIIPRDSLLLFQRGDYVHITEIHKVRKPSKLGLGLGRTLITFGQGWIGYSLYAAVGNLLTGGAEGVALTVGSLAVGGLAWCAGKLIQKLSRRKSYKMSEYTRLRIMDIRWTVPDDVNKA